jgi:hypothetical protein
LSSWIQSSPTGGAPTRAGIIGATKVRGRSVTGGNRAGAGPGSLPWNGVHAR